MENEMEESILGIYNIWFIGSGVMVNRVSPNKDTMALWLGR
jgi:hypothetical protein